MKRKNQLFAATILLMAFALWTLLVRTVDVQPIGPQQTAVGLATLNRWVHQHTGVHMALYTLTDWLSLIPIGLVLGFGFVGLRQWTRRKGIRKVDRSLWVLGIFYLVVAAAYILFEIAPIHYRPVLILGALEASYPSSTTLLTLTILPTAMLQLRSRMPRCPLRQWLLGGMGAFTACRVIGRAFSGVTWFADIVGGILLSAGLVMLYSFLTTQNDT